MKTYNEFEIEDADERWERSALEGLAMHEAEIEKMLASENFNLETLAIVEGILDLYSDLHKDVYCVRPRNYIGYVHEKIKRLYPKLWEVQQKMWDANEWWDYSCEIQRKYWEQYRKEHC